MINKFNGYIPDLPDSYLHPDYNRIKNIRNYYLNHKDNKEYQNEKQRLYKQRKRCGRIYFSYEPILGIKKGPIIIKFD
jgi:hypothetical protein